MDLWTILQNNKAYRLRQEFYNFLIEEYEAQKYKSLMDYDEQVKKGPALNGKTGSNDVKNS